MYVCLYLGIGMYVCMYVYIYTYIYIYLSWYSVSYIYTYTHIHIYTCMYICWRRQWHPTPVLLPGKSHGWRNLVGGSPWGRRVRHNWGTSLSLLCIGEEMATHSSVLVWRIPGTGKPGGLLSMGSHKIGHDWSDLAAACMYVVVVAKSCPTLGDPMDCNLPGSSYWSGLPFPSP